MTRAHTVRVDLRVAAPPDYARMIAEMKHHLALIAQNPMLPSYPYAQVSMEQMTAQIGELEKTLEEIQKVELSLQGLYNQQRLQCEALRRANEHLESALSDASNGDETAAKAWVGKLKVYGTKLPVSVDAPRGMQVRNGHAMGSVVIRCARGAGAYAYVFQYGTDPLNPDAWPAPVIQSGSTLKLTGLTVGQRLYVRTAMRRRRGGQGAWSDVLSVLVR